MGEKAKEEYFPMNGLTAPLLFSAEHHVEDFNSGEPALDNWLKKRALKNQTTGASRCFVISRSNKVIGYYAISAGAIVHEAVPKAMRRNMPNPLPIILLGRLAIDKKYHNKGLGSALLRDAMLRILNIAGNTGIFAILVHALSEKAKQFYLSRGFLESPIQPMTLFITLETVRSIMAEPTLL